MGRYPKRKRVLPNLVFKKLWDGADKCDDKTSYINKYTLLTSKDVIKFKTMYNIEIEEAYDLLSEIYEKQHMSFKDILELAGKRKADISNTFCVPIRTVENWYNGGSCTSYMRLEILRHYHLINLGKQIYTEYEEEYQALKPSVYKTKEGSSASEQENKKSSFEVPLYTSDNSKMLEMLYKKGIQSADDLKKALQKPRRKRSYTKKKESVGTISRKNDVQGSVVTTQVPKKRMTLDEIDEILNNYQVHKIDI